MTIQETAKQFCPMKPCLYSVTNLNSSSETVVYRTLFLEDKKSISPLQWHLWSYLMLFFLSSASFWQLESIWISSLNDLKTISSPSHFLWIFMHFCVYPRKLWTDLSSNEYFLLSINHFFFSFCLETSLKSLCETSQTIPCLTNASKLSLILSFFHYTLNASLKIRSLFQILYVWT